MLYVLCGWYLDLCSCVCNLYQVSVRKNLARQVENHLMLQPAELSCSELPSADIAAFSDVHVQEI